MTRTATTQPTVAQLEAEQERLAIQASQLREQAEQARHLEHERQEKQRDKDARRLLDAYDEPALDAEVRTAEQELRAAVLADPVYAAAIDLYAARIRRYEQGVAITAAANRLGQAAPPPAPVGALDLPEYLTRLIAAEAAVKAEDAS